MPHTITFSEDEWNYVVMGLRYYRAHIRFHYDIDCCRQIALDDADQSQVEELENMIGVIDEELGNDPKPDKYAKLLDQLPLP